MHMCVCRCPYIDIYTDCFTNPEYDEWLCTEGGFSAIISLRLSSGIVYARVRTEEGSSTGVAVLVKPVGLTVLVVPLGSGRVSRLTEC